MPANVNEVFLSKTRDINTIDALLPTEVEVLTSKEFKECQKHSKMMT
jgi:hypothetical protein